MNVAGATASIKLKNKSLVQRNWSCEVRRAVEIIRAYDRENREHVACGRKLFFREMFIAHHGSFCKSIQEVLAIFCEKT